ncbi:TPA: hypothetical protein ACG35G_005520, partial [Escherichia coli]
MSSLPHLNYQSMIICIVFGFVLGFVWRVTKDVATGSALPGHAGHGLVGFQLCGLSVVCGLCRASILA